MWQDLGTVAVTDMEFQFYKIGMCRGWVELRVTQQREVIDT